ncbi:MAG: hypothetical protein GQ571_02365 [Desulfobacterales bacterium]|nr:hypothetical protein [Desulfobacterales bacterium]
MGHIEILSQIMGQQESPTTRTAGGLDFSRLGKRQGREVPQSLRVEPDARQ